MICVPFNTSETFALAFKRVGRNVLVTEYYKQPVRESWEEALQDRLGSTLYRVRA